MKNTLTFDILKPEPRRMLALLIADLQAQTVCFEVSQDYNLIFVTINP